MSDATEMQQEGGHPEARYGKLDYLPPPEL